jgi:hypothetical protein
MDHEDGIVTLPPTVALLDHLQEVWPRGAPFASTEVRRARLVAHHPETWGLPLAFGKELTRRQLRARTGVASHWARLLSRKPTAPAELPNRRRATRASRVANTGGLPTTGYILQERGRRDEG